MKLSLKITTTNEDNNVMTVVNQENSKRKKRTVCIRDVKRLHSYVCVLFFKKQKNPARFCPHLWQ